MLPVFMTLPASLSMLLRVPAPGLRTGFGVASAIFVALAASLNVLLVRTAMAAFAAFTANLRHVLPVLADSFPAFTTGVARFF